MERERAREVIAGALRLARERVTGDPEAKEISRERLADLAVRVTMDDGARPSAGDLREALGDPGDREVRAALDAWQREDPRTPQ